MTGQCSNQFACAIKVAAELRTAELVRECMDAIDAVRETLRTEPCNALRGATDAADGAQNPDFIARAYPSIGAPVTHERGRAGGLVGTSMRCSFVAIFVETGKTRHHVVGVHMSACRYVFFRASNRPAVFAHGLGQGNGAHREFVAARYGIAQGDDRITDLDLFTAGKITQRDRHVIA